MPHTSRQGKEKGEMSINNDSSLNMRVKKTDLPQKGMLRDHLIKGSHTWDLEGISLGEPYIGKVLPKPFMVLENSIVIPIMGLFCPKIYPILGFLLCQFSSIIGIQNSHSIFNKGIFLSQDLSTYGFLLCQFPPSIGMNIPILFPTTRYLYPKIYPIIGFSCPSFSPILALRIPILFPSMGPFCPSLFLLCQFSPYNDLKFPLKSKQWD